MEIRADSVADDPLGDMRQSPNFVSIQAAMIAAETQRSFRAEVLGLVGLETEDQMDERLQVEAKEMGLKTWPVPSPEAKAVRPTRTSFVEPQRRSESIDSRTSQSTGFTSNYSEISRVPAHGRRMSKTSLSFRDYDSFMSRGRPNGRLSMSFSPPTTPSHSTFSLPLSSPSSSPKKSFLSLRGMSVLKILRTEANPSSAGGCPHCPRESTSQRRSRHELLCGHRLCTQALRQTILAASENPTGAVASCCGKPIPGNLIEAVLTTEEQNVVLEKFEQWDKASSLAPSVNSAARSPPPASRLSAGSRTTSNESGIDSVGPNSELVQQNRTLMDLPEYQDLQRRQADENDRFVAWIDKRRAEVQTELDQLRKEMKSRFESAIEDLVERHASAVAWAEDKQVKAEADMREAHDQEKQNNATALKHMEAYCAGTYSNGDAHGRTITEQDLLELEKNRAIRDGMDFRHQSAINVLRGGQSRRMKLRGQRQAREVQELARAQRMEELEFEREWTTEGTAFDSVVETMRVKMGWRWEIRGAILARRVELTGLEMRVEAVAGGLSELALPVNIIEDDTEVVRLGVISV